MSGAGRAVTLGIAAFALYVTLAGTRTFALAGRGHYVTLAGWMLEGRVSSETPPPDGEDVSRHGGRYFITFPPLPAVLLAPFVTLFPGRANPVLFTAAFGAANVVLMASFLRRALPRAGVAAEPRFLAWMLAAFALGTAHLYSAAAGTVWFTSHVCGLTFLLLAAREAVGPGRPAWCGGWLGLAVACRYPLGFTLPFFLPVVLGEGRRAALRRAVALALPLGAAVSALLLYNRARFGAWLDFGYSGMDVGPRLQPFHDQGLFSLAHLPRNAYYALVHAPRLSTAPPFLSFDAMGNSFLLVSPFLLAALVAGARERWRAAAWAATAAVLGTDLLYFSTGFAQFGWRYSLDAMPMLMLLAAAGFRGQAGLTCRALVALSIALNVWGAAFILNWPRMWSRLQFLTM